MLKIKGPKNLAEHIKKKVEADLSRKVERGFGEVWAAAMRQARSAGLNPDDYTKKIVGPLERRSLKIARRDGSELSDAERTAMEITEAEYKRIMDRAVR
jgi:hypothetical protein